MKNFIFLLTLSFGLFITSCSDACKDVSCNQVGTCDDGTCLCDLGYSGDNCETESRTKFLGDWTSSNYTNDGNTTENDINITLAEGTNANDIIITFPRQEEWEIPSIVDNNGNMLTTTGYVDPLFSSTFNGTITIENDILTMNWTQDLDSGLRNITATFTRI